MRGLPVVVTGVDVRQQSADHNTAVATGLGMAADFVVGGIADAVLDPAPDVVLALHACDTATDDALARAVGWDAPLVLAAPVLPPRHRRPGARNADPAPCAMLTRTASCASGSPTRSPTPCGPRLLRCRATASTSCSSWRASTPRATPSSARSARGGRSREVQVRGVRRPRRHVGIQPRLAEAPRRRTTMREQYLLGMTAIPVRGGRVPAGRPARRRRGHPVRGPRDRRVERAGRRRRPVGHHQRLGRLGRVFTVDPATGETVGVTQWSADPVDVEALAPAGGGEVWVGDIGDNRAERPSVSVARVPVGPGAATSTCRRTARLPREGPRRRVVAGRPGDRPPVRHQQGRLRGSVYAAPERLAGRPAQRLTEVGPVLAIATDAAFFPDGQHIIVRNYSEAAVYSWPELDEVGRFQAAGPAAGRGHRRRPARRGDLRLVRGPARPGAAHLAAARRPERDEAAGRQPTPSPSVTPSEVLRHPGTGSARSCPRNRRPSGRAWGWALGGLFGLGIVVVLARALRPHGSVRRAVR